MAFKKWQHCFIENLRLLQKGNIFFGKSLTFTKGASFYVKLLRPFSKWIKLQYFLWNKATFFIDYLLSFQRGNIFFLKSLILTKGGSFSIKFIYPFGKQATFVRDIKGYICLENLWLLRKGPRFFETTLPFCRMN